MKKRYQAPTAEILYVGMTSLMAGSVANSQVDKGSGPSGGIDTDKDGSDESDAKQNTWSQWED